MSLQKKQKPSPEAFEAFCRLLILLGDADRKAEAEKLAVKRRPKPKDWKRHPRNVALDLKTCWTVLRDLDGQNVSVGFRKRFTGPVLSVNGKLEVAKRRANFHSINNDWGMALFKTDQVTWMKIHDPPSRGGVIATIYLGD